MPIEVQPWPAWRKIVFRFFFIYLLFVVAPWTWLDAIPGVDYVTQFYYDFMDWAVKTANAKLFHVRPVLVPVNGSGDTSWGWTQLWLLLTIALTGCIVWAILDRARPGYSRLNYLTCLFTRYYVAMVALSYGIIKLFALQMWFPNLSQLATPLGDYLPMRLCWMFVGYSQPYQVFSGAMEVIAALLLLYRRTATLGVLMACGVFINVMMLNLSYDIPVKLYSMQLVVLCLFLLVNEWSRVVNFFILNKATDAGSMYQFPYTSKRMRITRIILKIAFLVIAVVLPFFNDVKYYKTQHTETNVAPLKKGIYDIPVFVVNHDSVPALVSDSLRWQDIVFDNAGSGSVHSTDTAFRQRYRRGYFMYAVDSVKQLITIKKTTADSIPIVTFHFQLPNDSTVLLWGKRKNDSLFLTLKLSPRHFQLAEKQFHWLSEYNR